MRNTITLLLLPFIATGCATYQVVEPKVITEKIGRVPELNITASIPVGGTLYSQFRYWSRSGVRLSEPVNVGLLLGRISTAAGDFVVKSNVNGKTAFCTESRAYSDPLTGPTSPACFVDSSLSGSFTHVTAAPGVIWIEKALPTPVRYESSELVVPRADAFRYELLFQGSSNKTLRIAYREFSGDLARPAFFQDATYEAQTLPMTVSFRTVRLEIIKADNNGLTYRVLSGF